MSRAADPALDPLLDAARDCVLAVGLRRTTLTDVARRAGVSRMTMYRRWPDMRTLIGDLMTREWSTLARVCADEAVGGTARERLVDGLVRFVTALRTHPMFRRIVEMDPEILLPYLVDRRGTSQDLILGQIVTAIAEGRSDGSLSATDPALLARTAVLAAQGFVFSAATMAAGVTSPGDHGDHDGTLAVAVTPADLDRELRVLLDRYLAP